MGRAGCPCLHIGLGREKGSRKDRGGQGPWDQVPAPLFLLAHQMNSQRLATLWSISPTQALFSTHLSKQPLIKQNEQKVGGRGAGSEGTGELARVALVAQPLLA